jgi:hypothetical protein
MSLNSPKNPFESQKSMSINTRSMRHVCKSRSLKFGPGVIIAIRNHLRLIYLCFCLGLVRLGLGLVRLGLVRLGLVRLGLGLVRLGLVRLGLGLVRLCLGLPMAITTPGPKFLARVKRVKNVSRGSRVSLLRVAGRCGS